MLKTAPKPEIISHRLNSTIVRANSCNVTSRDSVVSTDLVYCLGHIGLDHSELVFGK